MTKKKTTKRLGKKVSTEDLYEQCYTSDFASLKPVSWANIANKSNKGELLKSFVTEKTDSDYIKDIRDGVEEIIDYLWAMILIGCSIVVLVFVIILFLSLK